MAGLYPHPLLDSRVRGNDREPWTLPRVRGLLLPPPRRRRIKRDCCGIGDVEALDRRRDWQPRKFVAMSLGVVAQAYAFGPEHQRREIGRASCRERVCKYV